jgi:hypothetical protein
MKLKFKWQKRSRIKERFLFQKAHKTVTRFFFNLKFKNA